MIASELEKRWEEALVRIRAFEQRLDEDDSDGDIVEPQQLDALAQDLQAAWDAPGTTMRHRQRLISTLIEDIIADIDDETGEIVLVIHWKGGRHTELRTKKPKPGEHGAKTSEQALGVIREMASRWSDEAIAAAWRYGRKLVMAPEGRHIMALFTRRNSRLRKGYAT